LYFDPYVSREERGSYHTKKRGERKYLIDHLSTTKKINLCVNEFVLRNRVSKR
jgi:hypothetical protein